MQIGISLPTGVFPHVAVGGAVTLSQLFANEFISLSPLLLHSFRSWLHLSADQAEHFHLIDSITIREALLILSCTQSFFGQRCFMDSRIFPQTVIFRSMYTVVIRFL
jgi:hypothetical protein